MSKLYYSLISLTLIFSIVALSSCQKDFKLQDTDSQTSNPLRGHFTCLVNGQAFESELNSFSRKDTLGMKILTIQGIDYDTTRRKEDYKLVTFTINYYEGPKDYPVVASAVGNVVISNYDDGVKYYTLNVPNPEAMVSITNDAGSYDGTFLFDLKNMSAPNDTVYVKNGNFQVKND